MICRDIWADTLKENALLGRRWRLSIPSKVWMDVTFSAWNDYASETKQAWLKHPPKETPCVTKMEFSHEYEAAVNAALIKKNQRIYLLFREYPFTKKETP